MTDTPIAARPLEAPSFDVIALEHLRELNEKATPFRPDDLMAYEHGGGRLAILRDGQRQLIADFYGDGPDRDFFMAAALFVRAKLASRTPSPCSLGEDVVEARNAALDDAAREAHKAIVERAFRGDKPSPGDCSAAAYHAILALKSSALRPVQEGAERQGK